MDRFDDRTPLWDYSSDRDPNYNDDGQRAGRDRSSGSARDYAAADQRPRQRDRFSQRGQGRDYARTDRSPDRRDDYRRDDYDRERARPSVSGRDQQFYRDESRASGRRDERAGSGFGWPSEFGFPPEGSYSPYGNYPQSRRPDYDDGDRGFLERAGDEVMSWFGDRDARRRREEDHRGRGPKNYARSDERIREDVNDRLTEDVWIDASEIEVAVQDGEVTLTGTVEDRRAKRRAEDLADDVTGVKHVQNNLRYTSGVVSPKLD